MNIFQKVGAENSGNEGDDFMKGLDRILAEQECLEWIEKRLKAMTRAGFLESWEEDGRTVYRGLGNPIPPRDELEPILEMFMQDDEIDIDGRSSKEDSDDN